ncbi:MAG: hypothetical protein NVSMB27_16680 [Ktedonobacteraceae bacterium]
MGGSHAAAITGKKWSFYLCYNVVGRASPMDGISLDERLEDNRGGTTGVVYAYYSRPFFNVQEGARVFYCPAPSQIHFVEGVSKNGN